jgi:hypothetical protein
MRRHIVAEYHQKERRYYIKEGEELAGEEK